MAKNNRRSNRRGHFAHPGPGAVQGANAMAGASAPGMPPKIPAYPGSRESLPPDPERKTKPGERLKRFLRVVAMSVAAALSVGGWAAHIAGTPSAQTPVNLLFYSILVAASYFAIVLLTTKYVEVGPKETGVQDAGFVLLFVLTTLLLVLLFAGAWHAFGFYRFTDEKVCLGGKSEFTNAFYFSTVIFSTLGFGDYLPCNASGKLLTAFEALLALTHLGTFFSLLLVKRVNLTTPRQ